MSNINSLILRNDEPFNRGDLHVGFNPKLNVDDIRYSVILHRGGNIVNIV